MAGTANDYLGTLSVTRSGRTCVRWLSEDAEEAAPKKKKTSFESLVARAITNLRINRENALKDSVLEIPKEKWNEISLRSRLRRGLESTSTRRTPRPRRITEIQNPDGSRKLVKYGAPTAKRDTHTERTTTEAAEDDDDFDLFKLKPATFGDKKTSKTTSKKPKDSTTHSLGDDDYPGVFRPYQESTTTDASSDYDSFDSNPGTFRPYQASTTTTEPSETPAHSTVGSSTRLPQTGDAPKNTESVTFSDTTPQPHPTDSDTDTTTKKKNGPKSVHKVDPRYLNDTLYPEQSVKNASNFCRNPSRNIGGTWCYTTDPEVPQDLCNVRDCEQPGAYEV